MRSVAVAVSEEETTEEETTEEETEEETEDDDYIVSPTTYGDITWSIDSDGKLTVEGTVDIVYSAWGRGEPPWHGYNEDITSAVVNLSGATDLSYMFYGCSNMKSVDLSSFDMGAMERVEVMLDGATSLAEIYAPLNLSLSVSLPDNGTWYREDNDEEVTELPTGLTETVRLYNPTAESNNASSTTSSSITSIIFDRKERFRFEHTISAAFFFV